MTKSCAVLAFLFLAGCATSPPPPNVVFLGSGIELQSVPGHPSTRSWSSRPGALADYHSFLFEPVVVSLGKAAPEYESSAHELKILSEHLRTAFTDELTRGGYKVVDKAGAGVIRVRAAITELVPVHPSKNLGAKAIGSFLGPGGILLPTIDIGQAAIEVDMRDSNTNARVAAFADRKTGRKYFGGLNSYRRWGDVESAFQAWAREFRVRLDQVHGVAK
ncbi:MAG: hypothetical protein QOE68_1405 [Thermoanaerobaculia bacterium]|jgi:hypothetical protein|nr:hypothetical protein [Thermoanaerobaculia bacterium]